MTYTLGSRSLKNLEGVHPALVRVVKMAIQDTEVDFSVIEGLRSVERQKELVASGASMTMKSRHIKQPDGFGHAVDIYPYINGKVVMSTSDPEPWRAVKRAMFKAADKVGVRLRWGNDWDMDGVEVGPDPDESFVDWPHFEIKGGV